MSEAGEYEGKESLSALPHIAARQRAHRDWLEARGDELSLLLAKGFDTQFVGEHLLATGSSVAEEERAAARRLAPLAVPDLQAELADKVSALRSVLREIDPLSILAIASFTNVFGAWGTYHEPSHAGSEVVVELLAGLLVTQPTTPDAPPPTAATVQQVLDSATEILEVSSYVNAVIGIASESGWTPELEALRVLATSRWMRVRGDSYRHHGRQLALDLYEPVAQWMRDDFGFSIQDFFEVVDGAVALLAERVNDTMNQVRDDLLAAMRENRSEEFRAALTGFDAQLRAALTFAVDEFSEQLGPHRSDVAKSVVDYLTLSLGSLDASAYTGPYDPCPLTTRPIVRVANELQIPVPGMLVRDPHRLFEAPLGVAHQKFSDHRARVLDEVATRVLVEGLPGASRYLGLYYWLDTGQGPVRYEADGLITFENVLISVEGKGGPLSVQARRGDLLRAGRDLKRSMEEAWIQSARLKRFIESRDGGEARFDDEHGKTTLVVDTTEFAEILFVNPTLHSFDVFALQLPALRDLGLFGAQHGEPWSVFVNDLRVIVDMCQSPAELLHYIRWRQQLGIGDRVFATDELDIFGEYLFGSIEACEDDAALFFANSTVDFDAYYAGILGEGPPHEKPHKVRGSVLEGLLTSLSARRPRGWLKRSFTILDMPLEEAAWVNGWLEHRARRDLADCDAVSFQHGQTMAVAMAGDADWMDIALDREFSTRGMARLIVVRALGDGFELVVAATTSRARR